MFLFKSFLLSQPQISLPLFDFCPNIIIVNFSFSVILPTEVAYLPHPRTGLRLRIQNLKYFLGPLTPTNPLSPHLGYRRKKNHWKSFYYHRSLLRLSDLPKCNADNRDCSCSDKAYRECDVPKATSQVRGRTRVFETTKRGSFINVNWSFNRTHQKSCKCCPVSFFSDGALWTFRMFSIAQKPEMLKNEVYWAEVVWCEVYPTFELCEFISIALAMLF